MTVKGKLSNDKVLEKQRMQIIKQSAPVMTIDSEKKKVQFSLGISNSMLKEIESALQNTVGLSKTGFILQAIHEKLIRTRQ